MTCFQFGFRVGASTKLDDRVIALEAFKTRPCSALIQSVYPNLYPVHMLDDQVGYIMNLHSFTLHIWVF